MTIDKEFASQAMQRIPKGYIDKTICGCGLTTVCLENDRNTVIAMPSIALVRNKEDQYKVGAKRRVSHTVLGVYGQIGEEEVKRHISICNEKGWPIKIAVTYDSLWKVEEVLNISDFVIDESDRILGLTHLKLMSKKSASDVSIIDYMMDIAYKYRDKVSFISATPSRLEFMPEWISELNQVKMLWENTTTVMPITQKVTYPYAALKKSVILPIHNIGYAELDDGTVFRKAIIFLNSVTEITRVCKECKLKVEDVAIVCSDNSNTNDKIGKYHRLKNPKKLPKFTFLTSTGFQGIDLDDAEAMNVVVSSTSADFTMVDMRTDLKQCMSRQRNKENPHYGKCIFIYNQCIFEKSEQEVMERLDSIKQDVTNQVSVINKLQIRGERDSIIKLGNNDADFRTYAKVADSDGFFDTYKVNEHAFEAHRQFILETRRQFTEGFEVQSAGINITQAKLVMYKIPSYTECCEFFRANHMDGKIIWPEAMMAAPHTELIEGYWNEYKAVELNQKKARELLAVKDNSYERGLVLAKNLVKPGQELKMTEAKDIVRKIYIELEYAAKAKADYLLELVPGSKKVQVNGIKVIRIPNKL
jgi:hypothetical protein